MTGILMSLHLFEAQHPNASGQAQLRLACGYENGGVMIYGFTSKDRLTSIEGRGWEMLLTVKLHVESGALRVALSLIDSSQLFNRSNGDDCLQEQSCSSDCLC